MSEAFKILALSANGSTEQLIISPSVSSPWNLVVSGLGMQGRIIEGNDLFDALINLRKELEGKGVRLLCAGARRDAFPSGMARSMGGARKAYIFELGKSATELVDIFADAVPDQVCTVDEQQRLRQQWIASLREKMK
ncbi:hypothetical protein [Aquidulcibacter sp.]|jgi:hypothetical protein|uniref:hypothetical protein n=1 Tax=Aquidulcibacter sp. TaxID=2052990 RepID=UPI0037BF8869